MKTGKLKYSGQAKAVMEGLNDGTFDIEKFEQWVLDNKFIVGGGYLVEYLEKIKRGDYNGLGLD
jgi:hypothetical protein